MENNLLEKVYLIIGELYVSTRMKIIDVESSYKNLTDEVKKLSEEYNIVNEERNRLLAEIAHLKMTNDKLPK